MIRWYEGMFLFDSAVVSRDPQDTEAYLKGLLEKHGAKIHSFEKWDDRKLAYEINKVRRGTYFLVIYQQEPSAIVALRRDCKLSESVLRQLILQDDKMLPRVEERAKLKKKRDEEAAQAAAEGIPSRRRR
ncbi:30S ribosomal protein S6 [Planctomycetota bacterium]